MKTSVKSLVILATICVIVAIALAATNVLTAPKIEENEKEKTEKALLELLPDSGKISKIENLDSYTLPKSVTEVYRAENGGHVIKLKVSGYGGDIVIMCGISPEGKVVKTRYLSGNETKNIGEAAINVLSDKVIGKDKDNINEVDTVANATVSSKAYRSAVKDALDAVSILVN